MKEIVLFVAALAASGAALAQYKPDAPRDAVVKQLKRDDGKTIKDMLWTSPTRFKVGVLSNGKNRDGYAAYVCEVLRENGLARSNVTIDVIDIAKLVTTEKWEKLGSHHCK